MLWSNLFTPTLRENPVDAVSAHHRLLLRAGYARPGGAGNFVFLPLGFRSLGKIGQIVRTEMNGIGGQEFLLPLLDSAGVGELVNRIARADIRSQKQLPQIWYQIQRLLGDDSRQRLVMSSHWFDVPEDSASSAKHYGAFQRIFDRCGLRLTATLSEFVLLSDAGGDVFAQCQACGYFASLDTAVSDASTPAIDDPSGDGPPEEFYTPGRKTIAEVSEFAQVPPTAQMKSLVMEADGKPLLALVRGDHQVSRAKLAAIPGVSEVVPAQASQIREWFGADPGSLGPIGVSNMRIIADRALEGRRNMIAGANRNDYHLRNVTPGRDFPAEFLDIRRVADGDRCSSCSGQLVLRNAIAAGRIHKHSAEIVIDRILYALIEQNYDDSGMCLPAAVAPFEVIVTPVNNGDALLREGAKKLYDDCQAAGIDALYDDRDERPGSKFKDADLIGVPYRITLGKKLADGLVEFTERSQRSSRDVALAEVVPELKKRLAIEDTGQPR